MRHSQVVGAFFGGAIERHAMMYMCFEERTECVGCAMMPRIESDRDFVVHIFRVTKPEFCIAPDLFNISDMIS